MPFVLEEKNSHNYPLYYFTFSGSLTSEDFKLFKETFNKFLEKSAFGTVFDLRKVTGLPSNAIMDQLTYMKEYEEMAKKHLIASSIILEAKWMQQLLWTMMKLKKPVAPNYIASNKEDAIEFVEDHISLKVLANKKNLHVKIVDKNSPPPPIKKETTSVIIKA